MTDPNQKSDERPTSTTSGDKATTKQVKVSTTEAAANPSEIEDDLAKDVGIEVNDIKTVDVLLWEDEMSVRDQVSKSPITGNFLGAFFVNIYSAIHIVAVYLISLESIISITLSVSLTVCKLVTCPFWNYFKCNSLAITNDLYRYR